MGNDLFENELLACLPVLKAQALSLCRNSVKAEDLVQETVAKALAARDRFASGTNMAAWLFTILRNDFRSEYRKRRREVHDIDEEFSKKLVAHSTQEDAVYLGECMEALSQLSFEKRQAIELVGAMGYSYEDSAQIAGCKVGTIKSRLNRAREALVQSLSHDDSAEKEREHTVSKSAPRFHRKPQPPAPASPARRPTHEVREAQTVPRTAFHKPPPPPKPEEIPPTQGAGITLFDIRFVLERTITLPDGNTQRIYKAA